MEDNYKGWAFVFYNLLILGFLSYAAYTTSEALGSRVAPPTQATVETTNAWALPNMVGIPTTPPKKAQITAVILCFEDTMLWVPSNCYELRKESLWDKQSMPLMDCFNDGLPFLFNIGPLRSLVIKRELGCVWCGYPELRGSPRPQEELRLDSNRKVWYFNGPRESLCVDEDKETSAQKYQAGS